MRTVIMNMVRIFDGDKVLVLDKKKVYGWEGLTFPGGKVEPFERFDLAAVREVKEETNLDIDPKDLEFDGFIQWADHDNNELEVGLIYTVRKFSGELIQENREGKLFFVDYETFKTMDGHSASIDSILKIYDKEKFEVVKHYSQGKFDYEE